ncbi:ead/Ea22-like family protein [Klebsiella pneumoniae]|uniref:ead/Ea22-like family protein n=1 Tax=Klebsiella pneumoniae TaxID=573 RepID=UPI0039ECE6F6
MTDITELAQSLKAAAENAGADYWQAKKISGDFYVIRKGSYKRECGYTTYQPIAEIDHKPTRDYVAIASPGNILALVEALEKAQKRIAELESSGAAPGILLCTECSFVQTKNIISVTADTITTVEIEPEPCPNDCGQLQPVTWKSLAIQLMFTTKQGVSELLEAKKRIAELESRTVKLPPCVDDLHGIGMVMSADAVVEALTSYGIKVEAE